jgi:excisionase family DNA binding protein
MKRTKEADSGRPIGPPRRWLTAAEVAELLNLSLRTVRRLIKDQKLRVVHVGHSVRVRPEDLDEFIGGE